jgi:hypothetical protein
MSTPPAGAEIERGADDGGLHAVVLHHPDAT